MLHKGKLEKTKTFLHFRLQPSVLIKTGVNKGDIAPAFPAIAQHSTLVSSPCGKYRRTHVMLKASILGSFNSQSFADYSSENKGKTTK